jgi:hypothetical protein
LDIATFVKPGQHFRFVKLKDDNNGGDGADIDAVGALNSLTVEQDVTPAGGESPVKPR